MNLKSTVAALTFLSAIVTAAAWADEVKFQWGVMTAPQVRGHKSVLRYFSPESQARVTMVWPRASP